MRLRLFGLVIAAAVMLAACQSVTPANGALASAPSPDLVGGDASAVKIAIKPKALDFPSTGKKHARTAVVTEKAYHGEFTAGGTCARIAKAAPARGSGPSLKVTITPLRDGACELVFSDAKHRKAELAIQVGPTPSPSTSPSPSPSPSPSTSPSPPPGVYVTYSAPGSTHVVRYDVNGNVQTTGSFVGVGNAPSTILYYSPAPNIAFDSAKFYIIANNAGIGVVNAYTPAGVQLSGYYSPPPVANATAIAYGVVTGSDPMFWVADGSAHTIKVTGENGDVLASNFPTNIDTTPGGLAVDLGATRYVYVANTTSGNIEEYDTDGNLQSTEGGFPQPPSCASACTPAAVRIAPEGEGLNGEFVLWKGSGGASTIALYNSLGQIATLPGESSTPFAGLVAPTNFVIYDKIYVLDGTFVKTFNIFGDVVTTTGSFSPGFPATSANGIDIIP